MGGGRERTEVPTRHSESTGLGRSQASRGGNVILKSNRIGGDDGYFVLLRSQENIRSLSERMQELA